MIEKLPISINLLFGLTVLGTVVWFYFATKSKKFLMLAISWIVIQTLLGLSGFYQKTEAMPPRIMLVGVLPTLIFIAVTFLTSGGKVFIDKVNLRTLTFFHTIRIPVEIVLALLSHYGFVSIIMTFEGANFDLFSGITAPIVAFFSFRTAKANHTLLLVWNIICLLLLLNVVITAIFAVPSPIQRIAFDQPNVAILFFPFNLLPSMIVPTVLFGHLVAIKQLIQKIQENG